MPGSVHTNTMVLKMDLESEVRTGRSSGCFVIWALFRCYSGAGSRGTKPPVQGHSVGAELGLDVGLLVPALVSFHPCVLPWHSGVGS